MGMLVDPARLSIRYRLPVVSNKVIIYGYQLPPTSDFIYRWWQTNRSLPIIVSFVTSNTEAKHAQTQTGRQGTTGTMGRTGRWGRTCRSGRPDRPDMTGGEGRPGRHRGASRKRGLIFINQQQISTLLRFLLIQLWNVSSWWNSAIE